MVYLSHKRLALKSHDFVFFHSLALDTGCSDYCEEDIVKLVLRVAVTRLTTIVLNAVMGLSQHILHDYI